MNLLLLIGGCLSALLGIVHSVLGERLLLGPLFEVGQLPKLIGSRTFAKRTLRFAWHLTTVLMVGVGAVIAGLAQAQLHEQTVWILKIIAVMNVFCAVVSFVGSKARHFSWIVFLVIAATVWLGAS